MLFIYSRSSPKQHFMKKMGISEADCYVNKFYTDFRNWASHETKKGSEVQMEDPKHGQTTSTASHGLYPL